MARPTTNKLDPELKGRWQHLEREERRETFKEEAMASWAAFQETGRHVTGAQVREWLSTWGTDEEQPAPKVHK